MSPEDRLVAEDSFPVGLINQLEDLFVQTDSLVHARWMQNLRRDIIGLDPKMAARRIFHLYGGSGSLLDIGFNGDGDAVRKLNTKFRILRDKLTPMGS